MTRPVFLVATIVAKTTVSRCFTISTATHSVDRTTDRHTFGRLARSTIEQGDHRRQGTRSDGETTTTTGTKGSTDRKGRSDGTRSDSRQDTTDRGSTFDRGSTDGTHSDD
jgi:hypothetical protein